MAAVVGAAVSAAMQGATPAKPPGEQLELLRKLEAGDAHASIEAVAKDDGISTVPAFYDVQRHGGCGACGVGDPLSDTVTDL